jgi:hypothetical protein
MRLQRGPGFSVVVRYCERPVFSSLRSGRRSFCRGRSGVLDVFSPGLFMKQSGTIRKVRDNWSLVSTAVENKSFNIRSPHPANIRLAAAYGGVDKLPRAARLEDLLRAWGAIYNSQLPASSNQRLRSVRLDAYRWEGGINGEYDRFVESWRAVL